MNNLLKQSKRDYFRSNLDSAKTDPKKTWKLINQLTSRSDKCCNINKVEVNGVEISDTCEIAEAFNTHFTEIGENLANKISITDTGPISYIKPTNSTFAFKTTDVTQVKRDRNVLKHCANVRVVMKYIVPRVNGMPQKQSQTNRTALAPFGIIFCR